MDTKLQQIRSNITLSGELKAQLVESGFALISGPFSGDKLKQVADAYDEVMKSAAGPHFNVASTTTRMSDLLSYSSAFDDVFLYPPLFEACTHLIGEPFKLSSFLGRTLRGGTPAQGLHADLPRDSDDAPMLGFILMIDPFRKENGATRFVPGSHCWPDLPAHHPSTARAIYPGEILGCADAGTMILFNGAVRHGHTANVTAQPRRSIQGYFVRRSAISGFDFRSHLLPEACIRMNHLARQLLHLD